ncbi:MAG: 30S ribosome-binding factor RbfA [Atopobiaceae bacterium]|nr:30S ribosome-binding factor RbfA [Atopobiaceae bacterium]
MKQNNNSRRMAEQAREKLGYIMLFEVADPALDLVTLTGCEVSIDKSVVKAYVSCDAARYDKVQEALARAKGRIRSLLGRALGWRVTPELVFVIDTTVDEAEHIATLLEDVPESMHIEKDEFGYPLTEEIPEDVDE